MGYIYKQWRKRQMRIVILITQFVGCACCVTVLLRASILGTLANGSGGLMQCMHMSSGGQLPATSCTCGRFETALNV